MTTSGYGRVVCSALLTSALKRLRQVSGRQQRQVADALDWSVSKLIRIEGDKTRLSTADLEALLRHYGVADQGEVDELATLARESRVPGWWDSFRIQDEAFARYIGYEAGAASIRMAQGFLVPGILQTESYARHVTGTYTAVEEVESVVRVRLERQEQVYARAPQQYHILDEAVLRRVVGDVMPGQLQHLIELAGRPEVTIRVVPFGAGMHFGMRGPFVLLGFDVPLDTVLFLESAQNHGLIVSDIDNFSGRDSSHASDVPGMIASFEDGFQELSQAALDERESINLMEQIIRENTLTLLSGIRPTGSAEHCDEPEPVTDQGTAIGRETADQLDGQSAGSIGGEGVGLASEGGGIAVQVVVVVADPGAARDCPPAGRVARS